MIQYYIGNTKESVKTKQNKTIKATKCIQQAFRIQGLYTKVSCISIN